MISRVDETLEEIIERLKIKTRELANKTGKLEYEDLPEGRRGEGGWDCVYSEPDEVIWKRNNIPKRYIGSSFDTFAGNDPLVKTVQSYLEGDSDIIFMGKTGSGKSHLAASCLKELRIDWARFVTAPELLLEIRASFGNREEKETEQEIINRYCEYQILVLDDLGAEKSSDYSITTLYLIIDRRIRNCKRTIITTNLTLEEIELNLDARIASRLSGMKIVKITMPDYRKKR